MRSWLRNCMEYVINQSWQYTSKLAIFIIWSNTGVSFSRGSLTICEYSAVKTFKCWSYYVFSYSLVNLMLLTVCPENLIKCKFVVTLFLFKIDVFLVIVLWSKADSWVGKLLFLIQRSHSNKDLYTVIWVTLHTYSENRLDCL